MRCQHKTVVVLCLWRCIHSCRLKNRSLALIAYSWLNVAYWYDSSRLGWGLNKATLIVIGIRIAPVWRKSQSTKARYNPGILMADPYLRMKIAAGLSISPWHGCVSGSTNEIQPQMMDSSDWLRRKEVSAQAIPTRVPSLMAQFFSQQLKFIAPT